VGLTARDLTMAGSSDNSFNEVLIMSNLSTIAKIAARFDGQIIGCDRLSLVMDIDAVNDINPLNLEAMVNDLDSLHVAHDVLGIAKNFDRKTKTLVNGWTPRFTLPQ
tara:strand:+ start:1395 stop:1715 length:321 start_codon:yes stop_codon:yes gene_type:complete